MNGEPAADAWTAAVVVVAFLLVAGAAFTVRPSPASASRLRRLAEVALFSDAALIMIGLLVILAIGLFIAPYLLMLDTAPSPIGAILGVAKARSGV